MAIAAALLAALAGPMAWRTYETRREALAARAQVLLALQIASRQLNSVHRQVVRPSSSPLPAVVPGDVEKEGRP